MEQAQRAILESEIRELCLQRNFREASHKALSEYGAEILGWLVSVVPNQQIAEDICQDFCLAFWHALPGFEWKSSLRVWTYSLARYTRNRYYRDKHRKRQPESLSQFESELSVGLSTILSRMYQEQRLSQLAQLRRQLSEDEQTLLILRVDRELSFREIGEVMDWEEATARKNFQYAKSKLTKLAKEAKLI
jgi:RNA polymerase sigma-70 factor, ECF subfamily